MRRGSPRLETHPRRSFSGGPSKRARISKEMSRRERAPRGDGRSTSKRVQTSPEPLSIVQETGSEVEHLKKKLKERKINHKLL